jgi:hypothetical protein
LRLNASNGIASQSGWSGSGGGLSQFENEPSFQQGVQSSGARTSPDVAYNADPYTGYRVYDSVGGQGWLSVGGTSAGAPQWAGILALVDQARAVNGQGSLGSGQAAVYNLPGSDFQSITSGSNGYPATTAYNLVTGLGSPNVSKIVSDLSGSSTSKGNGASGTTTSTTTTGATTTGNGGTKSGGGTTHSPTAPVQQKAQPRDQVVTEGSASASTVSVPAVFVLIPTTSASSVSTPAVTSARPGNDSLTQAVASLGSSNAVFANALLSGSASQTFGPGLAFNILGSTGRGGSDTALTVTTVSIHGVSGDLDVPIESAFAAPGGTDDSAAEVDGADAGADGWDPGPCDVDVSGD